MSYHSHFVYRKECEHEVNYCKKCNVCFCKKCGKEWTNTYFDSWKDFDTVGIGPWCNVTMSGDTVNFHETSNS
jgi:hypothetical protein